MIESEIEIVQDFTNVALELFDQESPEVQQSIIKMYQNSELDSEEMIKQAERIIFRKNRPPTAREFLDPENGWLSRATVDYLFPYVKELFIDIVENSENYWCIILYGCTRIGKSYLAALLHYYTITYLHHLRNASMFFGLSPKSQMSLYNLSFNLEKTKEVLIDPLFEMMEDSDRFIKTHFKDKVNEEQDKIGPDFIVYSTAASTGHMTLASRIKVQSSNKSPLKILGSNILQAYFTELTFWQEDSGANPEEIYRILSDSIDRLKASTQGVGQPLSWILIDSSANDAESDIEKYILKDLMKRDNVFHSWKAAWEVKALRKFPIWEKTGETFPVITGDGNTPAAIVTNPKQLKGISKDLIDNVPVDVRDDYERNLLKSIKDIGGKPSSSEAKFIQQNKFVESIFDNSFIDNVEGILYANASDSPNQLIWNMIKEQFFVSVNKNESILKRAPNEPRWFGIDLAYAVKGDIVGLSLVHKEFSRQLMEVVYVTDFSFAIGNQGDEINLEAIRTFIVDVKKLGSVFIKYVAPDGFQSREIVQYCRRNNIESDKQSVDVDLDPYLFLLSCLFGGNVKAGKNIFLRNNLKSLYRTKQKNGSNKIDHKLGKTHNKYFGDWENSSCGINAKDVSDALCQAVFMASKDDYLPSTVYEQENERLRKVEEPPEEEDLKDMFKVLHKNY